MLDAKSLLLSSFTECWNKPLLTEAFSDRQFSYAEFFQLSKQLSSKLAQRYDIGQDDKVVIIMDNRIETLLTYFACLHLGAVSIPINPDFSDKELIYILSTTKAGLIITTHTEKERVQAKLIEGNNPKNQLLVFDDESNELKLSELKDN